MTIRKKVTILAVCAGLAFVIGGGVYDSHAAEVSVDCSTSTIVDKHYIQDCYYKMCQIEELRYFILASMYNTFVESVLKQYEKYMLENPSSFQRDLAVRLTTDFDFAKKYNKFLENCEKYRDYYENKGILEKKPRTKSVSVETRDKSEDSTVEKSVRKRGRSSLWG